MHGHDEASQTALNIADAAAIVAEINRLQSVGEEELLNSPDRHYTIPVFGGNGHILIGRRASEHLVSLSARGMKNFEEIRGRVDPARYRQAVAREVYGRFVVEGRAVDEQEVARVLGSAKRWIEQTIDDWTVHIHPSAPSDPVAEAVSIGPIRINPVPNRGWYATVVIPECDEPTAERRALMVCGAALDAIALIVAGRPAHNPFVASTRHLVATVVGIDKSGDDDPPPHSGEPLLAALKSDGGQLLSAFADLLHTIADPAGTDPVAERIVDALGWYGLAMRESEPAARIVLFVNALERLTVTGDHQGVGDRVVRASAKLAAAAATAEGSGHETDWETLSDRVYEVRCDLVHGTRSPFDGDLAREAALGERLTRHALIGAL